MNSCSSRGGDDPRREKVRHQFGHNRLAEANGRSSWWRGFVDRAAAAEVVGSSSRWPHTMPFDLVSTSYVGMRPTIAGCGGMDAQCMEWDLARGDTNTTVGRPCTYHHQQHFRYIILNERLHLRENSHVCCGGAIIKVPHDPYSHSGFRCPVNNSWDHSSASPSKQKQLPATEGSPPSSSKQQRQPAGVHESSPLPPFPSAHGAPYVLCQRCGLLLHVPSPGTLLRSRFLTLKCGSCLNFSTFSTRHFYAPRSFASAGITPLPPSSSAKGQLLESTSMPGYGASHHGEALSAEALTCAVSESASHLNGGLECDLSRQNFKANCARKHGTIERMKIATVDDIFEASLEVSRHTKASACLDDDHGREYQVDSPRTAEPLIGGICADAFEDKIDDVKDDSNAESSRSQDKDIDGCLNVIEDLTADMCHNEAREGGIHKVREESFHFGREEEITTMSSVQSWVDSLSPEMGYESDSLLQCSEKCAVGCEKHTRSPQRVPLHWHFGYKSPLELFKKVSSEDQEMRTRTETNSSASSSSSPNEAHENPNARAACTQVRAPSMRGWSNGVVKSVGNSSGERDAQRSLPKLLMRGFTKGNHSQVSLKGKVVVNGHALPSVAVKQAEERAGKLRPGNYWYDCKAGFWGVEGGPCLGILPPLIEELSYPMAGNCSNGDTKIYINGRELHSKDLVLLSQRGLSKNAGMAYALGFDGVLIDETTGLEVKHLGKLAPTVERKGKGFGMFAADIAPQVKKQVLQDVKSSPVAF